METNKHLIKNDSPMADDVTNTTQSNAQDVPLQVPAKAVAAVVVAALSLLAAGAGSLGYLIVDHLLTDNGKGNAGSTVQFEKFFEQHRARVFETCKTNREAVELQLKSTQFQIDNLAAWIDRLQSDITEIKQSVQRHVIHYDTYVKWSRDELLEAEGLAIKLDLELERQSLQINELHKLFPNSYPLIINRR